MATKRESNVGGKKVILDVSTKLFARLGFEGVSMRQIAKESNFTLPTIYHHFGNKDELYKAVETEMYGKYSILLMDVAHEDIDPEVKLRKFIVSLIDLFENNSDFLRLSQRNLMEDGEKNHEFLVNIALQKVHLVLRDLLNEFKEGCGDGIGPIVLFSLVLGFFTMSPVSRLLTGYQYAEITPTEKRSMLTEAVINAIKVT